MINKSILVGRITKDIELAKTQGGTRGIKETNDMQPYLYARWMAEKQRCMFRKKVC